MRRREGGEPCGRTAGNSGYVGMERRDKRREDEKSKGGREGVRRDEKGRGRKRREEEGEGGKDGVSW